MKRIAQLIALASLALFASATVAEDLGVTMSVMADDDDNVTESVSRQIELPQPDSSSTLDGPGETPAVPGDDTEGENIRERLQLLDRLRDQLDADQRLQLLQDIEILEQLPTDQLSALLGQLDDSQLNELINGLPGIDSVEELVMTLGDTELLSEVESITGLELDQLVNVIREGELESLLNELTDEERDTLLNLL